MIAKFDTMGSIPNMGTPDASNGGSSKMLITLAVIGLVGYLGYKYVYLPSQQKKQVENDNQRQAE
jgi:predicted negative regulator of RcsB-dependent stress response